eukprot:scaffold32127_cov34-Cyclotella_meneghiniana.AAC.1
MTGSLQIAAKTLTNSTSTPTNTLATYGGVAGVNLTAIAVTITAETSTNDRTGWRAYFITSIRKDKAGIEGMRQVKKQQTVATVVAADEDERKETQQQTGYTDEG